MSKQPPLCKKGLSKRKPAADTPQIPGCVLAKFSVGIEELTPAEEAAADAAIAAAMKSLHPPIQETAHADAA